MTQTVASRSQPVQLALASAIMVMAAGGMMTDQGPWFQSLSQPSWRPPGWLFGPVWTVILALVVMSFAMAWGQAGELGQQRRLIAAFGVNALLNVLWNVLFFQMRRPDLALLEIALLFLSIAVMMAVTARLSALSALLLAPYALWVAFAAVLNLEIIRLNGTLLAP